MDYSKTNPLVSVITVTNRYGGIDVAYSSLRKQSYKNIEWILADDLYDERKDAVAEYVKDFPIKHIKPRPKAEGHVWNLVNAYNDALRAVSGEIVISLDDFIWIPHNGIERFLDDFRAFGDHVFTGVGHKAPYPEIKDPKGLITIFGEDYKFVPRGIHEVDTRIDGRKEVVQTNHSFFELNWCAFSRELAKELGGFDEDAQRCYGGQDRNFALRAEFSGRGIFMDKGNECIGLFHQGFDPRPEDWEPRHYNKNPFITMEVLDGKRPIKLNYI